jgi:Domain of unknown function (DUF362)
MKNGITRRGLLKGSLAWACFSMINPFHRVVKGQENPTNPLFWVKDIPPQPFYPGENDNHHAGIDALLQLMGENGLKFYRSLHETALNGPSGMIHPNDVVLIKVNSQWKYRGCTNSDLIRGLIQVILDHPDGFTGEVIIFDNGQGRGTLNCDNTESNYPDGSVHANANDESQSFLYLVNTIFNDPRVSSYLLDPIRNTFIGTNEHIKDGYRKFENISYPCLTTAAGHRVELLEGIWQDNAYTQNLKLINVPVLKYHDTGGSEMTASLKHFYGVVSMADGYINFRHFSGLGETCGKMVVSVRTPVLNIIDATWVSFSSLSGYPANTTYQANQILACQDPVALDYWASKYVLYPISNNSRHLPNPGGNIDGWLTNARDIINGRGGLYDPDSGILIETVTKNEQQMLPLTFSFFETVSTPDTPSGATTGLTGSIYTYVTGGAVSNIGDPIQYLLDWGDGSNSGWLPVGQSSVSKSWTSTGTYHVVSQARCANHTSALSIWSEPLLVTINDQTAPAPPTNVQASDGTYMDKVQVAWTASSGATSYTIYRAASKRGSKTALGTTPNTTYDDTTASVGRTYYYYVKASNSYGTSGFSGYNTGYLSDGKPSVPTNVQASDGTYMDKVQVAWTASSGATSYTIYRATSKRGSKTALGTTPNTTYDDTTASVGRTYYYWVTGTNVYGASGFSTYDTGYR